MSTDIIVDNKNDVSEIIGTYSQYIEKIEPYKYRCLICNYGPIYKSKLPSHMSSHFGASNNCPVCGKLCSRRSHLIFHIKSNHRGHKLYECDVCHTNCVSQLELIKHMLCHPHIGGKYECAVCREQFKRKYELQHHLSFHTNNDMISNNNNCNDNSSNNGNISSIVYNDTVSQNTLEYNTYSRINHIEHNTNVVCQESNSTPCYYDQLLISNMFNEYCTESNIIWDDDIIIEHLAVNEQSCDNIQNNIKNTIQSDVQSTIKDSTHTNVCSICSMHFDHSSDLSIHELYHFEEFVPIYLEV